MLVCVCVCICMCVYMYVCVCACSCTIACMWVCAHVCMCVCVCVFMCGSIQFINEIVMLWNLNFIDNFYTWLIVTYYRFVNALSEWSITKTKLIPVHILISLPNKYPCILECHICPSMNELIVIHLLTQVHVVCIVQ